MRAVGCWAKTATGGESLPPAIRDELVHLQYARIAAIVPVLYFSIALIAAIAGAASGGGFDIVYHVLLPGGFIAMGCYRCLVWHRRKSKPVNLARIRQYLRSTTAIAMGLGLVGGLWTLDAYFDTRETRRILPPVFIFMITFAGAICLTSMPRAATGVLFLALTPTLIAMMMSTDVGIQAMAVCFLIVSLLTLMLIVSSFKEMVSGLTLRHELRQWSETDPLTGLANRRAFCSRFESLCNGPGRTGYVAIVMIDLDGFKLANDRFGHAAGDAILVQVGERLGTLCPDAACIARLGGDEFALLLEGYTSSDQVRPLKRAVRSILSLPYHYQDRQIMVSASVGTASGRKDSVVLDTLMRDADGELYRAKQRASARRRA